MPYPLPLVVLLSVSWQLLYTVLPLLHPEGTKQLQLRLHRWLYMHQDNSTLVSRKVRSPVYLSDTVSHHHKFAESYFNQSPGLLGSPLDLMMSPEGSQSQCYQDCWNSGSPAEHEQEEQEQLLRKDRGRGSN